MPEHVHPLLAGVFGFIIGGLIADAFTELVTAVGAGMTLGSFAGGAYALVLRRPAQIPRLAGVFAVAGGCLGLLVLGLDVLLRR